MSQSNVSRTEKCPEHCPFKPQHTLKDLPLLSWGVGICASLFLLPFSIHLSFTCVQGILWGIILLPLVLSLYPLKKQSRMLQGCFVLSFLFQFGLLLLILLGFFWDSTQTPSHLSLTDTLAIQPLTPESSNYLVETPTHYTIYVPGEFGPRLLSVPHSKTTIHSNETVSEPQLKTFTGCSHHWIETLINRLFHTDEHLSFQKVYEIHLPQ